MKAVVAKKQNHGLTMIEVVVVLAVATVATLVVFFPLQYKACHATAQTYCANNLRQVGLSFRVWAGDNNEKYPMELSETNGGTMEFTTGPNAFRHFLIMSNELSTPKVLYCRNESGPERTQGTNFSFLNNSNLSYFVGIDANQDRPAMILAGDRLLTNGSAFQNGILTLTANRTADWTIDIHEHIGNIALADGSVQKIKTGKLRAIVKNSGVATNRLQMPVLTP